MPLIEAKNGLPVSVRDLTEEDIPYILDYWFHSPPGFIESMGVDPSKLLPEPEFKKFLLEKIRANRELPASKLNVQIILYEQRPIGFHTLGPLEENESAVFHAHIWNPEYRRRGIGMFSYPAACRVFFKRFNLKRILFKTPLQNTGAIRVKEKLGIHCIGEETVVNLGILKDGTYTKVFELQRQEII
jgi:RimJ/RimL family protein N-acetyltransferase